MTVNEIAVFRAAILSCCKVNDRKNKKSAVSRPEY